MKIQTILATKGTKVVPAHARQLLKDVIGLLVQHNIGALVVVDDADKPVGIISERDLIRAVARGDDLARPVSAAMTRAVIFGTPQDDLASVMKTRSEEHTSELQ